MAQTIITSLLCDMPHDAETVAGEGTVSFSFGGTDYDMDLCALDGSNLRRLMVAHAAHARRVPDREVARRDARPRRTKADREQASAARNAIREWGAAQEPPVLLGPKGMIAGAIRARYEADRSAPPAIPAAAFRTG